MLNPDLIHCILFSIRGLHMFLFLVVTTEISQRNTCVIDKDCINQHDLNVTFLCNNNSYETVNDDANANCSMNNSDNNISSFENGKGHNIINSTTITNNSTNANDSNNNMTLSCENGKRYNVIDSAINANNSMNDADNVIFSCDNNNNYNYSRKTIDSNINAINFTNSDDSYKNMTFSCDNGSANNSVTGVVLNNVMLMSYDNGNNSSNNSNIVDDVINAKTSTSYNDNNITFCDDDDIINNIASANTTNVSEYLPSTSEITAEIEAIESIHNNISTNNDKNSSESLIDISSVNTFGCKEDNLYVPFSQPKGLQKKNFCYYCKKFQSKIARHLENVHKLEPEVKKFSLLPKVKFLNFIEFYCIFFINY